MTISLGTAPSRRGPKFGEARVKVKAARTPHVRLPNAPVIILSRKLLEQLRPKSSTNAVAERRDLTWVRPGQLYDRIGLRQGDRLISLNGVELGNNEAVLAAGDRLLAAQSYTIELTRDGRRIAISVNLVKHD